MTSYLFSSGLGSVLGSLDLTTGGYVMNNLNIFSSAHVKQDDRPATLASPIVVTQAKSACGSRFVMGKIFDKAFFKFHNRWALINDLY